jgi:glycosyltransferase involved in cell wall biosynthesis
MSATSIALSVPGRQTKARPVVPVPMGRVVVVSYAFPPDNASGAVRIGKFVQNLAFDYGWDVDVVTPRRKTMSQQCAANRLEFPRSVSVIETRNFELFDFVAKIRNRRASGTLTPDAGAERSDASGEIRQSDSPKRRHFAGLLSDFLAVPDTRTGWIFWAICAALRSIKRRSDQTILFSSGPPHSAHIAAAVAKLVTGRPWIVDLRDPWSTNPYNAVTSGPARRWNEFLERTVLSYPDAIICNTLAARKAARRLFPKLPEEKIVAVPNGYDPEDFIDIVPQPFWPPQGRPVLIHAGSIYGQRLPYGLLEALGILNDANPQTSPQMVFLGDWDLNIRRHAEQMIARLGISHLVIMKQSLPRIEALRAQAAADGLILLGDTTTGGVQVPGKLFEYLRLQKPLVSLFASGSPVEEYLHRYSPVHASARPDCPADVAVALQHVCERLDELPAPQVLLEELSRGHQVTMVHNLLADVLRRRFDS